MKELNTALALIVCVGMGFIAASLAVRYVLRRTKIVVEPKVPVPWLDDPGFWIGLCEYVLVVAFVAASQYTALGIVFAAKGFARKDDDPDKNTYFLLGTLVNVCLAMVFGLLLRLWLGDLGVQIGS
ncbi:MAG: hypothetical protein AAF196_18220 [Planctomycetota bacterium]